MIRFAALLAATLLAAPAAAQEAEPAPPTLEQTMLLRCSAAFAIVAGEQQRGLAAAQAYPPLAERGREFFVRASARLMDERQLSRAQVEAAIRAQVAQLQDRAALESVMQPCLAALDASGL